MSFYAPNRKLSLSNAGHPPPLWYRDRDKAWQILGIDPSDRSGKTSADVEGLNAKIAGKVKTDIDGQLTTVNGQMTNVKGSLIKLG